MAINCINYGLPNRSPKITKRKISTKKTIFSKCMLKSVELFNPEPMPYQKDSFKPCTVSRLVDIPRRVNDGFMINDDISFPRQRGIILHKDRYDWSSMKDILSNQNERLAAEENYVKKAKYFKNLSEQKFKISNQILILEGEPMLPISSSEKIESKKEKNFFPPENETVRRTAPSIVTNYNFTEDLSEQIDSRKPVPMDVHKIKLNFRQSGENITSAPVQAHNNHSYTDSTPNMYVPTDGRDSFERLPPINNKQKDFDPNFINLMNGQNDFDYAYKQSERFNRPNVRLQEYIVDAVPVKFNERADIQAELRCLKSLALPTTARDLYVGRGINLPLSHATKNPKGKYIHSSASTIYELHNHMKIDTPGGGSVTINTKTPPHKNSPMFTNQSHLEKLTKEKDQINDITEKNLSETTKFEEIFNSLSPDSDGFVGKSQFFDFINNIDEISENEKQYFEIVFHSTEKVKIGHITHVLKSLEILKNISPSLRETILQCDGLNIKSVSADLLVLLDQPITLIKITEFCQIIPNNLDNPLTEKYCAEVYKDFREKIDFNENFDEENILHNHILIFLPFFFTNYSK